MIPNPPFHIIVTSISRNWNNVLAKELYLIGCSKGEGVDVVYAPTVRWNDTDYSITPNTLIAKEDIGEQITTIKKFVKRFPKERKL